ncbi:MAG: 3'(2'),5'-bisphosphate nucleotidase CysQ [Sulfuricurvum sp.]|uniref:3'(2'),5'-bisphosphate nucleotidase CysQ n=1 Tax=Sulfuricurvum sp. TaxID=2025608 RepID=UPI00261D1C53|nr:3'(2'),5'-bisphosphate nucleotidase CysQ [Sulfuricurvum sp.]MDD2828387.1 3'(2'),5'-bisphosphate nucleotidase CysQ [Sulfuricurvum sp.]MDD4949392.1 3'(2'),5'-bisphosphate nucleotidase CysQ [Sulfuricurvum sp.]
MLNQINIDDIVTIAKQAGDIIMDIYAKDFSIDYKEDQSPLTEADQKANELIVEGLSNLLLKFPILSEEGKTIPFEERKEWEYFWMVDPLDGTKEFIKKNDEFTVNIALIHNHIPILGVVYAPALSEMYWATQGNGAYKNGIPLPLYTNTESDKQLKVVASKSHLSSETQDYIDDLAKTTENIECVSKGSSLKLCMVAEGSADVYPRLAPTMEWDTAAADAIVREAGKMTYQFQSGTAMEYNKENLLNPWFVVR